VTCFLGHRFVSPRSRAQKTLELLDLGCHDPYPWQVEHEQTSPVRTDAKVTLTDDIREWDYGEYEGITSAQIETQRAEQGLGPWDIWKDGCPGGESPQDIIKRVDRLIREIRDKHHRPVVGKPKDKTVKGDVLVVGHGHILRAFAIRWIGQPLTESHFIMEAGGVGTLSYEHHSIDEPAILLGGGFVVGDDK
jgi:sedoheptulose-bisphosphatase